MDRMLSSEVSSSHGIMGRGGFQIIIPSGPGTWFKYTVGDFLKFGILQHTMALGKGAWGLLASTTHK